MSQCVPLANFKSSEEFWIWPHYESCKNISLEKLNVCCPTDDSVQISALRTHVETYVTTHESSTFRWWSSDLIQAVVKHVHEYLCLLRSVLRRCWTELNSSWMVGNIAILQRVCFTLVVSSPVMSKAIRKYITALVN